MHGQPRSPDAAGGRRYPAAAPPAPAQSSRRAASSRRSCARPFGFLNKRKMFGIWRGGETAGNRGALPKAGRLGFVPRPAPGLAAGFLVA